MSGSKGKGGDHAAAGLIIRPTMKDVLKVRGHWHVECLDREGKIKWTDDADNIIVNVGLTYLIGVALLTTTQIALTSWFVGLTAGSPTIAAGDTMASHAGWTEISADYSQGTRPAWSGVAGSAGAASNSASPAAFSITATQTIGGCFLNSVSTKGGTTGTLFSGVAFTGGNRSVVNTDTLNVTYNLSVADDGV